MASTEGGTGGRVLHAAPHSATDAFPECLCVACAVCRGGHTLSSPGEAGGQCHLGPFKVSWQWCGATQSGRHPWGTQCACSVSLEGLVQ